MNLKKHAFLFAGILLLVLGVLILFYSNQKIADCESFGGQVIQAFSSQTRTSCAEFMTVRTLSIALLAGSVACFVIYFIRR